ncbi:MAG: alpha/beta fold hydrolase [Natronospirillum sp.]|uniref:YqiA/YcfP family alpha/beta fold hydrolase n=1 Tax=Natronospirillum sp. TaxID=2812955 RepID=UPI0025FCB42B|nr:YqiA/YcfP family alpha/beta fold hydrolase [Natronospirillum sp.]MCH8552435.1 alpha/beta fold hydrolase [Natronospirillum sp.]
MIIYIHGFASSGFGTKARFFRDLCQRKNIPFMAPSLPWIPELAIGNLADLIQYARRHEPVHLIGSSLGGYYGLHLAHRFELRLTLINPSVQPALTLGQLTGQVAHFHDGSHFEWTPDHTRQLDELAITPEPSMQKRCLLLVQSGDETLDYREAVNFLPRARQVVESGGDHGFQGIERHADRILDFFGRT